MATTSYIKERKQIRHNFQHVADPVLNYGVLQKIVTKKVKEN